MQKTIVSKHMLFGLHGAYMGSGQTWFGQRGLRDGLNAMPDTDALRSPCVAWDGCGMDSELHPPSLYTMVPFCTRPSPSTQHPASHTHSNGGLKRRRSYGRT